MDCAVNNPHSSWVSCAGIPIGGLPNASATGVDDDVWELSVFENLERQKSGPVCGASQFDRRAPVWMARRHIDDDFFLGKPFPNERERRHQVRIPAHQNQPITFILIGVIDHRDADRHVRSLLFGPCEPPGPCHRAPRDPTSNPPRLEPAKRHFNEWCGLERSKMRPLSNPLVPHHECGEKADPAQVIMRQEKAKQPL